MSNLNEILELIQQGEKETARSGLMEILKEDRSNELAWLYMAACAANKQEFSLSIQRVLEINPSNGQALQLAQKHKIAIPGAEKAKKEKKKKAKSAGSRSRTAGCVRVIAVLLVLAIVVSAALFAFTQMGSDTPEDGTEVAAQNSTEEAVETAADATEAGTEEATDEPTQEATDTPEATRTPEPTDTPTDEPTEDSGPAMPPTPTPEGTGVATEAPEAPADTDTPEPTDEPTEEPTEASAQNLPPTPAPEGGATEAPTDEATQDSSSVSGLPPTPTPEGDDGIGGGGGLATGPDVLRLVYDNDSAYLLNFSEEDQDVTTLNFVQGDIESELSGWFLGGSAPFILKPGQCYQIGININAAERRPTDCTILVATGVDTGSTHFWLPGSSGVDEFEVYSEDSLLDFCAFSEGSCDFGLPAAASE